MPELGIWTNPVSWMSYSDTRDCWREAENLGFDVAWAGDPATPPPGFPADLPADEALSVLPALAEATSKIGVGVMAIPNDRRTVPMVAKSTTIIDHISKGRLRVAFGPGSKSDELTHRLWGQRYARRDEQLEKVDETLSILRLLWTVDRANYEGRWHWMYGAANAPKPIQDGGPPLWIRLWGADESELIHLAARDADGVVVTTDDDAVMERQLDEVRRTFEARDRPQPTVAKCLALSVVDGGKNDQQRILADLGKHRGDNEQSFDSHLEWVEPLVGSADQVRARLVELTSFGIDHFCINLLGLAEDGSPTTYCADTVIADMRRLGAALQGSPAFAELRGSHV